MEQTIIELINKIEHEIGKISGESAANKLSSDREFKQIREALERNTAQMELKNDKLDSILNKLIRRADNQDDILKTHGQQLESIQEVLKKFTEISRQLSEHDKRITALENTTRDSIEIRKERIKTWGAIIASIVAATGSIIAIVLSTCL